MTEDRDLEEKMRAKLLTPVIEKRKRSSIEGLSSLRYESGWRQAGQHARRWEIVRICSGTSSVFAEGESPIELMNRVRDLRAAGARVEERSTIRRVRR